MTKTAQSVIGTYIILYTVHTHVDKAISKLQQNN